MTLICRHRVNQPAALAGVPGSEGVEIDLRSSNGRLVLEHDAFVDGPRFEDWLDEYDHAFLIANVKEEGLEAEVTRLLTERGLTEWAFLDQSFPFLVRSLRSGETRTMVRISEFESIRTALALEPRPQWVWVDSFTGRWPAAEELRELGSAGFRFMVVSPELQGRDPADEVDGIRARFAEGGVEVHGVCTKLPDLWR